MKKLVSITVCIAALLCAVSCAAPARRSASSSDAVERYASRLPDGAVVLVGDEAAARANVDLSALSDDGYIIRREGGRLTVAAKTEHSLDLASRRYQRCYAATDADVDVTCGEGRRVKSITLAGYDVSEYAIVYPTGLGYGVWDETYAYAAERLDRHGVDYNILCVVSRGVARHARKVYSYLKNNHFPICSSFPVWIPSRAREATGP